MKLVPVPFDALREMAPLWVPFLREISKDSGEPLNDLIGYVAKHHIRIALAVDDEGKPVALAGMRLWQRGADLIGDIVWCSGKDRHSWQHLVAEIENLLRQAGCAMSRPIARTGWTKLLKQHGYKATHIMMEKKL